MQSFQEQLKRIASFVEYKIMLRTRSNIIVEVDVSDSKCSPMGFLFLERVSTTKGDATGSSTLFSYNVVIGVAYRDSYKQEYLHVLLDIDKNVISFWDNCGNKESLLKFAEFKKISTAIPSEVKIVLLESLGMITGENGFNLETQFLTISVPKTKLAYRLVLVPCPICGKEIPEGEAFDHIDLHRELKLETSQASFNVSNLDFVYQEALDPQANYSFATPRESQIIPVFLKNIRSPDALRTLIPRMVVKEFRAKYFEDLSPETWEKIHATYFVMMISNLPLKEAAGIFQFSLKLAKEFRLSKLK